MNTVLIPTDPATATQAGMALLVTLLALALLLPLVYAGVEAQRFHLRRVQQELDLETAHRHAESALTLLMPTLTGEASQGTLFGRPPDASTIPVTLPNAGDGTITATLEDDAGRWNLNALRQPDGRMHPALHAVLARLFAREGAASTLLEQLEARLGVSDGKGDAAGGDRARDPLSATVGQPLHAMEELLMIPGWNADLLQRLRPFVTVDDLCHQSRLNINSAAIATLEILDPGQNWQAVATLRQAAPIVTLTALTDAGITLDPDLAALLTVDTGCGSVRVRAHVGDVTGILTARLVRNRARVTIVQTRWDG
ncbi:MAG: general secretion pathway protein GspK [Magnetococcales bacterium]|nr:general secretion pathway protein GspK [Magnetococcales bacterium]